MSSLTSIVAVGLDGAIGVQNRLPWKLKSDLRFFQRTTKSNVVIMGRKTYDSIGGCLPHRENLVLSHRAQLFEAHRGCTHTHSLEETLFARGKWARKDAFVIGGAVTYALFAPYVDRYLITVVDARFPEADAFFSEAVFGADEEWETKAVEVELADDGMSDEYAFQVYELRHKRADEIAARRVAAASRFRERNHILKRQSVIKRGKTGATLSEILSLA